ncbi:MAG: transglycosylase SLT domain-containing protein [Chlamydiales bacterium]|nr:transglycosylase SLT domain-containing protein [Chlamydiales bacterium]
MKKRNFFILVSSIFLVLACISFFGLREHFFPSSYRSLVMNNALQEKIDPLLLAALIYRESGFKQAAVSSAGAIGLMQIRPTTIKELARLRKITKDSYNREDLFSAEKNIRLGTLYMNVLLERLFSIEERKIKIDSWYAGDPTRVILASYNAGPTVILQQCLDKCSTKEEYERILQQKRPTTIKYANDILMVQKVLWITNKVLPL